MKKFLSYLGAPIITLVLLRMHLTQRPILLDSLLHTMGMFHVALSG
jgi:hypothetical protein